MITCPFSGLAEENFKCNFLVTSSRPSVCMYYRFYFNDIESVVISKNISLTFSLWILEKNNFHTLLKDFIQPSNQSEYDVNHAYTMSQVAFPILNRIQAWVCNTLDFQTTMINISFSKLI